MSYKNFSKEELHSRIQELEIENSKLKDKLYDCSKQIPPTLSTKSNNQIELLHVLLDVSKDITHHKNFKDSAHNIFKHLKQLIHADGGYIALLNQQSKLNEIVYLDEGSQKCLVNPELPMPVRGYRKLVYQSKKVMYHNDFGNSKWMRLLPKGHSMLHNVMFIPLLIDNEVIGLIGLSNKTGGFTDEDAEMAKEFGCLAVIALKYSNSLEENIDYQKKLKESEERFRLMIEDSPVMIWESGIDAKCIYFNKNWLDFRGRKMSEEVGDGWTEGLHPEDYDDCVKNYLKAFEKREKFTLEYRLKNKDGMYRCILDIGTPQFQTDGVFKGYIGSCIDITEQKHYEQVETEKKEFYYALFEKNKAVKLLIDPATGKIADANTAASEFYGYSLHDLRNMRITEINQLSEKEVFDEMQKAQSEARMYFEFVHKLADGSLRDVAVYSGPFVFKGKKLLYSIITDITDQKKAQEALRKSEEKFKLIVDALPQFVSYCDTDFRYVYVNKSYEKEFNLKQEEFINKPIPEVIGESSFKEAYEHLQKVIQGEYVRYYKKFKYQNGSVKHVDGQLIPHFDSDNKVLGYYGVLNDISPYLETREALKESEKEKSIILDTMSEMLTYYDKDLNIIWANKASRAYRNIENKNIEGFKCYEVFEGRDIPCPKCPVIKSIKSKRPEESEIKTKDQKYFKLRSYPVINSKNEIEGVVEFTIDITEQKQKDEELKKIYNLYRTLTSNLPGINVYLFDDEKRIIIAEGSEFKERIYLKSDFEGRLVTELDLDEKVLDYLDHLYTIALNGEEVSNELKYNKLWYQHIAVPVKDHKNKVLGGIIVAQNITEQKNASIELEKSKEKLKHLSHHLQQLIEKEKSHFAREIHDDLGQNLTIIKLNLALLKRTITLDREQQLKLKNIFHIVDETIKKMKKMSTELRPGLIDNLGLIPAIEWYVGDFQKQTGVLCNFEYNKETIVADKELAINIFRIIQESLTNVIKHAKAKKVDILINEKNRKITLKIQDDGKGIKPEHMNKANSYGILGMRERTELFNGKMDIYSEKAIGTIIKVEFPTK